MRKKTRKTNFLRIMGNSPRMRIIDFLIENDRTHWNLSELRQAKVSYSLLKKLMPKLVQVGIAKTDEVYGKMKLYKINKEDLVVKRIYDLYNEINLQEANKLK